jgi:hypothetical protein
MCRFVAIGKATAAEAEAQGLTVAATASESTPAGLVAAVIQALHPESGAATAETGAAPASTVDPDFHSSASGTQ